MEGAAGWEGPRGLGEFLLSCADSHMPGSRGTSLQDTAFAGETPEQPASFVQQSYPTVQSLQIPAALQGSKHQKPPSGEPGLDEVLLLHLPSEAEAIPFQGAAERCPKAQTNTMCCWPSLRTGLLRHLHSSHVAPAVPPCVNKARGKQGPGDLCCSVLRAMLGA